MRAAQVPLTAVFGSEIAEAKRMGFELQCRLSEHAVGARMQPCTASARQACTAASGQPGQAIESTAPVLDAPPLEVLSEVIRSSLTRAREVTA